MKLSMYKPLLVPGIVLVLLFVMGFVPNLVTEYEPMKSGYTAGLSPPSGEYVLGTDQLGNAMRKQINVLDVNTKNATRMP